MVKFVMTMSRACLASCQPLSDSGPSGSAHLLPS
jgi:hypothetical protein